MLVALSVSIQLFKTFLKLGGSYFIFEGRRLTFKNCNVKDGNTFYFVYIHRQGAMEVRPLYLNPEQ